MYLAKITQALKEYVENLRIQGHSIGFVPTMGALHAGHLELLKRSLRTTDKTVCSIFVNPKQFNDPKDLNKYPRTPEKDIEQLLAIKCPVLFFPSINEMFPPGSFRSPTFDFNGLEQILEGQYRPGHFTGVATVVHRLLQIVDPDILFMGQKDYQQVLIVKKVIEQSDFNCRLQMVPIVREANGLAMSSRNVRLSETTRQKARLIYQTLLWVKTSLKEMPIRMLQNKALEKLNTPPFSPEYFAVVDGKTMLPVTSFTSDQSLVAVTAVKVENIRLIDNMILQ